MPTNLLILPLLAGFLFVHRCHRYRFRAQHLDGYRLILQSSLWAVVFLGIARLFVALLQLTPSGVSLRSAMYAYADIPYLGTGLLSLVIGTAAAMLDNRSLTPTRARHLWRLYRASTGKPWFRRLRETIRVAQRENAEQSRTAEIARSGNSLIRLLDSAARTGEVVSITLSNRKWYVGFVSEAMSLLPEETHFRITPLASGYRDKDTMNAVSQISYRELYAKLEASESQPKDFDITIPLANVEIASFFQEEFYESYFVAQKGAETARN